MTVERILRGDPFHAPKAPRYYCVSVNGVDFLYATFDDALRAANYARATYPPPCVQMSNIDRCEASCDEGRWSFYNGLTPREQDRFDDLSPTLMASIERVRVSR